MKRMMFCIIAFISLIFSSCKSDQDENAAGTSAAPEMEVTASAEAGAINTESSGTSETSKGTLVEISETEIPEDVSGNETDAAVPDKSASTTEKAPAYDKNSAPVLTAEGTAPTTNYLKWTAVDGAQSYVLYLLNEQSGEFDEYGEVNTTSCNDIKLTPNTKYIYKVAARFPDGVIGKMSEAVSIYTYSLFASNTQGDWVYESEYSDSKGARILRRNIIDGSVEDMTGYSFYTANDICISGKYIFFIEDFLDYSGRIIRINIADKSMEVLREYISEDGFGCYGIEEMAVYDNIIFYTIYGSWSEMDEPYYGLSTIDFDGKYVDINANYNESYSPMYFLNDDENFYIVWRDEDIVEIETDDEYYLRGVYTDKCYVYDAAARERFTVSVPAETSDDRYDFLEYDGDFLYIEIKERNTGNHISKIKANRDGYEYID